MTKDASAVSEEVETIGTVGEPRPMKIRRYVEAALELAEDEAKAGNQSPELIQTIRRLHPLRGVVQRL